MKVILSKNAGFCFGVKRAVSMCEEAASNGTRCVTLGPIIHNTQVIEKLHDLGVSEITSASEAHPGDTVVIRSHGIGREEMDILERSGAKVIDATCPYVKRIHKIAEKASSDGRLVLIIGEASHPEVAAISGWCKRYEVFGNVKDVEDWLSRTHPDPETPVTIVSQTTGMRDVFELCVNSIKKVCTNNEVFDTICNSTIIRQKAASELAEEADAMVVIGSKNSSNTAKLAEICRKSCDRVFNIETAGELDMSLFGGSDTIGVTAGASTPAWIIKEVNQKMCEEIKNVTAEETAPVAEPEAAAEAVNPVEAEPAAEAVESFEEMLEKSIKTLHTGEKVTGTVAAITPTEISVDLGTKQSGYIPIDELTDDPSAKVEDIVKVGDEIETFVMRVNDVEGTVKLSKKRLDIVKNWDMIEEARADRTTVEGTVIEENKGGVVVSVKGVNVFVPASQTGLAKDVPMSTLLKQKVRLRITEVNQSRRRVVGSIRAVAYEERKAKADAVWADIEEGKKYKGIVKSLTSYGAFVDIGGIDGMIHVSEISWSHIKQPSDVLKIGDEIEVYVISFDKEKKKISLGYRTEADNPWTKFTTANAVGDVISVKIVKLMPFGAFAEILPGVDGLIHISQIADHRIATPAEVLKEGDVVDVKITEIDSEKHRVSLSIKALLEPAEPASAPVEEADAVVYDTENPPAEEPAPAEEAEEAPADAE